MTQAQAAMLDRPKRLITGGDPNRLHIAPMESRFEAEDTDYLDAPDLTFVGDALIANVSRFAHLQSRRVVFLWRRTASKTKGKAVAGKCQKPSGLLAYFSSADIVVTVAADYVNEHRLTAWQIEALLYHELLHTSENEKGELVMEPHDWEGFRAEVETYGFWQADIRDMADTFQIALFPPERSALGHEAAPDAAVTITADERGDVSYDRDAVRSAVESAFAGAR